MVICATAAALPYADKSVHICCTSPPYYAKRSYQGVEPTLWPPISYSPMPGLPPVEIPAVTAEVIAESEDQRRFREWLESGEPIVLILLLVLLNSARGLRLVPPPLTQGQLSGLLGLEPDPFMYIGHLVHVFREAWRVLRDDGILCVNIGDSFCSKPGTPTAESIGKLSVGATELEFRARLTVPPGLKPKDLMLIPARLALALCADGWTLRSRMPGGVEMNPTVIWTKNAMPESVRDRPSVDFEDVFIFSKSRRYCWDEMNARVRTSGTAHSRGSGDYPKPDPSNGIYKLQREPIPTRNIRASWRINTEPTSERHYAAWPRELVRRLVRIGTSDRGCCPDCGSQWVRVVERQTLVDGRRVEKGAISRRNGIDHSKFEDSPGHGRISFSSRTSGWSPSCSCRDPEPCALCEGSGDPCGRGGTCRACGGIGAYPPVPCSVLDPFSGIGRTGEVCYETGRVYMPAEISIGYAAIQARRLEDHVAVSQREALPPRQTASFAGPLFARLGTDG